MYQVGTNLNTEKSIPVRLYEISNSVSGTLGLIFP